MIVRNVESGWEIVYQSAHALLAGQLACSLKAVEKVGYRAETLAAIMDHDDHKEAFGKNVYLTELGAPKDFTQFQFTARERFEEVQRRIESGYRKHRWIGLLATRHAEELYGNEKISIRLKNLLSAERKRRRQMLSELNSSDAALELAYSIHQWCDRASLILCQKALPAMHRRIEIASLADAKRYEIWRKKEGEVTVIPWPFKTNRLSVYVEVRSVHQMTFKTDRELERCLKSCEVEERHWTFSKR